MKQAATLKDVNDILATTFMPPTSMREKFSLDKMYSLMKAVGDPQNKLKIVHVAGTSGKTSTCYYTAALLKAGGKKVGLTVSPHIDTINERVQVNSKPMAEDAFVTYFNEFLTIPEVTQLQPSYFEVMVAFAFWVFVREEVDYAVVEVGLGGLGDATNVIDRADKICVITDIGFDHMQVLGETITKIARQKAGIIQRQNHVFMMEQSFNVVDVVEEVAANKYATMHVINPQTLGFLSSMPPFARRNWQLARAVLEYITERDGLKPLPLAAMTKTTHLTIPARMEVVEYKGKAIILDGSHNQQKLTALVEGLQQKYKGQKFAFLLSFVQNKSEVLQEAVAAIVPVANSVIVTSFVTQQDFRHDSLQTDTVVGALNKAGITNVKVEPKPKAALKALIECPEPVLVITGSFYLLNHIRPEVMK